MYPANKIWPCEHRRRRLYTPVCNIIYIILLVKAFVELCGRLFSPAQSFAEIHTISHTHTHSVIKLLKTSAFYSHNRPRTFNGNIQRKQLGPACALAPICIIINYNIVQVHLFECAEITVYYCNTGGPKVCAAGSRDVLAGRYTTV